MKLSNLVVCSECKHVELVRWQYHWLMLDHVAIRQLFVNPVPLIVTVRQMMDLYAAQTEMCTIQHAK